MRKEGDLKIKSLSGKAPEAAGVCCHCRELGERLARRTGGPAERQDQPQLLEC